MFWSRDFPNMVTMTGERYTDIQCPLHIVLFAIYTDSRMYLGSSSFSQWKILLMFLFKSSVYHPRGTSLFKSGIFNLTAGS